MDAANDNVILDATGRAVFTGDQPHPYRTNTRFRKVDGVWVPIDEERHAVPRRQSTPEERAAGRSAAAKKAKAESKAMRKLTKVIAERQKIGNPSIVQSRGEDFPLLEALRRDGRHEQIEVVKRYRRLVALCEAEPLKGLDYSKADGGELVRESSRLTPEADIDAAKASDWTEIPDGEIKQSSKIKKSKGSYSIPAKRVVVSERSDSSEGYVIKTESLHIKITDETLNEHIDAKPILAELRAILGPLLDPFEDAVLGGQTFTKIGRAEGADYKPDIVGRTLVMRAIHALDGAWRDIDARERRLAVEAKRRFKTRLAANDNNPLRKVA
ncbi:hypothetical protein HAAEEKHM_00092 [Sinorhizobium phage AP-16-3]|nr:hypothetical protein HAAEEKHM_00092 [Sinorhizobium phage AP-16-3]